MNWKTLYRFFPANHWQSDHGDGNAFRSDFFQNHSLAGHLGNLPDASVHDRRDFYPGKPAFCHDDFHARRTSDTRMDGLLHNPIE